MNGWIKLHRQLPCCICERVINQEETGEPFMEKSGKHICYQCYVDLADKIYQMSGFGDGGIIHLIYASRLKSGHNRKKRMQMIGYKKILKTLLHKYKFKCVSCGANEKLTIDHIKPVSKGGTDDIRNLQILCKSCNSRKGNRG